MKRLLLALALLIAPAFGEETLTSGLSQDYLQINSTFTGAELTVYGAIENPGAGTHDVVVVVRGPDTQTTVRRKDRIAGMWINNARAKMWLPSYYFVTATRPLQKIAGTEALKQYELGLANLRYETVASDGDPANFAEALKRTRQRGGLYIEQQTGVEMQSATLFRVHVPIPAAVPRGSYTVEVYIFRNGEVTAAQSTPFYVDQIGIEQRLYEFAHSSPLSYGVLAVLMAITLGWASTFFFRRN